MPIALYSTRFFHAMGLWVMTSQELFLDSMVAVIRHQQRLTEEQAGLQLHGPTKNSDRLRLRVCCRGVWRTGVCIWIKLRSPSACPGANTPLVPVVWSSKACRLAAMMSACWAKLGSPCNWVHRKQWAPSPSNSTEWKRLKFPKEVWDFDMAGSKTCLPIQKLWREMKVHQAVHLQMHRDIRASGKSF